MFAAVGCENGKEKQESEVGDCRSWVRNAASRAPWSPRDRQPAAWKCASSSLALLYHLQFIRFITIPVMHHNNVSSGSGFC